MLTLNNISCQILCSWANLPPDLLLSIIDILDVTTSIQLSAVCTLWASAIRPYLPLFPPFHRKQPIPWLIRPYIPLFPPFFRDEPIPWLLCSAKKSDTSPNHSDLTFYDLSTAAYYSVQIPISIPIPFLCGHQLLGSYKGWLVTLDKQLQLHLIKPLTGGHVLLPSNGIEKEHPKKVLLCHHPDNTNELQAFCLTQWGKLFSTKLGDESWTQMSWYGRAYQDIVVYQGKVYAISRYVLSCWNLRSSSAEHSVAFSIDCWGWTKYLLEWNKELVMLMIDKRESVSLENHAPKQVKLYKIKFMCSGYSLRYLRSLKNDALFFGANCFYAVLSSCHDDIQKNCIYFTDQVQRCFHDAETCHLKQNFEAFDYGKQIYKPC